jgi:hypothetical protein
MAKLLFKVTSRAHSPHGQRSQKARPVPRVWRETPNEPADNSETRSGFELCRSGNSAKFSKCPGLGVARRSPGWALVSKPFCNRWEKANGKRLKPETVLDYLDLNDKYGGNRLGDLVTEDGLVILAALSRANLDAPWPKTLEGFEREAKCDREITPTHFDQSASSPGLGSGLKKQNGERSLTFKNLELDCVVHKVLHDRVSSTAR